MKFKVVLTWIIVVCFSLCLTSAQGNDEHLPRYYVEKAQNAFKNNDWGGGKQVLDEGLKIYPYDPDMRWLMGRYWFERKDYDKSRYHLVKSVEAEYNQVDAKQLLVTVEEITKHYSSAICYVNELLEVNPYWRGLWRRKIELYRKQGNEIEANRLLKRINQIYPNDSVLKKDLSYSLEQAYQKQKKSGRPKQAIQALEELLKTNPKNEQYYVDLCNLYLQQGATDKALEIAAMGATVIPGSIQLIKKRIGILTEQSRYPEAMSYLKEKMKHQNSASLSRLYDDLLQESAEAERARDPYILYGMVYERSHNSEALDYLLNTALSRGYDDDARTYLAIARKQRGNTKELLYKDYMLSKRTGDDVRAYSLLQQLYKSYPTDFDIVDGLCAEYLKQADKLIAMDDYAEALPHLKFVASKKSFLEKDVIDATMERQLNCLIGMKRYNEALLVLDSIHSDNPQYVSYIDKKAFLLDKVGRTTDALNIYYTAWRDSSDMMREFYVNGYEELAIPYIKKLIADGATKKAYESAIQLLEVSPQNDLGLKYAINSSALLGKNDDFARLTSFGMLYYPNDIFYKIKQATVLDMENSHLEAMNLLRPELENYPNSPELLGAFAHSSEYEALSQIKSGSTDRALELLDSALLLQPSSKTLKYAKGLAYNKAKQYDSAYVYLKYYEPSPLEVREYAQMLRGVKNRSYKNEIGFEYLQSRYAEADVISSVATAEYTRKTEKNTYTGRINYKGLDGVPSSELTELQTNSKDTIGGGTGLQFQAEWSHDLGKKLSFTASLAYGTKYFPKISANLSLNKEFKHEIEAGIGLGYRLTDNDNKSMIIVSPTISKTWDPIWASSKLDLIMFDTRFYWNLSGQMKFFLLDDGITNIMAQAGVGTSPELSLIDNSLLGTFAHTNTMVGLGGTLLLNDHLKLGLMGTWHTYYSQTTTPYYSEYDPTIYLGDKIGTKYKNLYNIYVQLFIDF